MPKPRLTRVYGTVAKQPCNVIQRINPTGRKLNHLFGGHTDRLWVAQVYRYSQQPAAVLTAAAERYQCICDCV